VEKISGEPFNQYAAGHIFIPLDMSDSMFNPPDKIKERIAPTEKMGGILRWGMVHDPEAKEMGGVAGHAGLFSTAKDLSKLSECLLTGGAIDKGNRILHPLAIAKMTSAQSPPGMSDIRGLGWDIDSSYSSVRGVLFPIKSFGHTGWTGTSIWIDPATST
jgi:CubicO group peptidase (beta-lactamase class C family)